MHKKTFASYSNNERQTISNFYKEERSKYMTISLCHSEKCCILLKIILHTSARLKCVNRKLALFLLSINWLLWLFFLLVVPDGGIVPKYWMWQFFCCWWNMSEAGRFLVPSAVQTGLGKENYKNNRQTANDRTKVLGYADDIHIIGENWQETTEVFTHLTEQAEKVRAVF